MDAQMEVNQEAKLHFKYLINLSITIHNSKNNDFGRNLFLQLA